MNKQVIFWVIMFFIALGLLGAFITREVTTALDPKVETVNYYVHCPRRDFFGESADKEGLIVTLSPSYEGKHASMSTFANNNRDVWHIIDIQGSRTFPLFGEGKCNFMTGTYHIKKTWDTDDNR